MASYPTKMFDRLDKIVFARYGTTDQRLVEWVLEQNPGIERYGILLPPGLLIYLPDRPKTATRTRVIRKINLLG